MCNSDRQGYDLSPHQGQRAWIPSRRLSSWWRTGKTCQSGAPGETATAGLGHCLQNSLKRRYIFRKKSDFYTDTHCNNSIFFVCTIQCNDVDRNHRVYNLEPSNLGQAWSPTMEPNVLQIQQFHSSCLSLSANWSMWFWTLCLYEFQTGEITSLK